MYNDAAVCVFELMIMHLMIYAGHFLLLHVLHGSITVIHIIGQTEGNFVCNELLKCFL